VTVILDAMPPQLASIAASAGLGALIGLIRQWSDQEKHPTGAELHFVGVRTHTFWAVLGCLAATAGERAPWALPVVVIAVATHLIAMRWTAASGTAPGGTSFAAALLTLFTGALVAWDETQSAVLVAALTMVLLGLKQPIHAWMRHFTQNDIRATLQFVAITGVVLPLVPNRDMGPYAGFNPYSTWLMVVLISGIGFTGYVAMRVLGPRAGILVTSLFGGLASSTATTLAFSRRSREEQPLSLHYAFAITTACTVMLPRVGIVIAVINPALGLAAAPALAAMAVPAAIFAVWFLVRGARRSGDVAAPPLHNPLSLRTAIKFALLYAAFTFLVKAATQTEWQQGLLPLSFVSGLTDMDAIALSMARNQRSDGVSLELAVDAVLIAAVANSLLKAGFAVTLGSRALRWPVALVLGATAAVGVAAMLWV
jgi:uncharacterized membrane protein (DUF4010 family)